MRAARAPQTTQLSLFAAIAHESDVPPRILASRNSNAPVPVARSRKEAEPKREPAICTVAIEDLPAYPIELVEAVDQTIAGLPANRMWFTYRDIAQNFGVSRATTARRVKEGLVPGVRFQSGRVLEDGAVRRFDRTQLKWLLLAAQTGGRLVGVYGKRRALR